MGSDGSYYALPHYEFYTGLTYNRTTFESLNAYFAADDEDNANRHNSKYGSANFVGDKTAEKSVGPDGKKGTQDDGLPKSLEEFIILCDYIKTESDGKISPLTVSGTYYYYVDYLVLGIWATIAGSEQMKNYYNCTGEILSGLGKMYAAGGEFTRNIDRAGGEGTSDYVNRCIEIYCKP